MQAIKLWAITILIFVAVISIFVAIYLHDSSTVIDCYESLLRQNYRKQLKKFNDRKFSEFPAGVSKPKYLPPYLPLLSIIMKNDSKDYTEWLHSADINKVQRSGEETVLIEDILKQPVSTEKLRLVLIEGEPGIGKSTLAKELVSRWVKQSDEILNTYKIVIFIQLRSKTYHNIKSIKDLLVVDKKINMTNLMVEIENRKGANILWILDGFDELPSQLRQNSSVFIQLITDKIDILENSAVIVTSRHSAASVLYRYLYSDSTKHIKIIGFNDTSIQQYATEYFKNETIMEAFKLYYKGNPMIESMLQVPLTCYIVCLIFNDTYLDKKPYRNTMTTFYNQYVRILLKRHLIKANMIEYNYPMPEHLILEANFNIYKLANISQDFFSLSKLAFDGVIEQKRIFGKESNSVDKLSMMDTIVSIYCGDEANSSSFLHATLQEYLAAIYLVNNRNEIFKFKLASIYHSSTRLEGVLVFYVGLLKIIEMEVDNVTLGILSSTYMTKYNKLLSLTPVLQRCLYEHNALIHNLILEDCTDSTVFYFTYRSGFDNFIQGFLVAYIASASYNNRHSVSFSSLHELQLFNKGYQSFAVMRAKMKIGLVKINNDILEALTNISAIVVELGILQPFEIKKNNILVHSTNFAVPNCLFCNLTNHPLLWKLNNLNKLVLILTDPRLLIESDIKLLEVFMALCRPLKELHFILSSIANISYAIGHLEALIIKQNISLEQLKIVTLFSGSFYNYYFHNRKLKIKCSEVELYTILHILPPIKLTSIRMNFYTPPVSILYNIKCNATVYSKLTLLKPKILSSLFRLQMLQVIQMNLSTFIETKCQETSGSIYTSKKCLLIIKNKFDFYSFFTMCRTIMINYVYIDYSCQLHNIIPF